MGSATETTPSHSDSRTMNNAVRHTYRKLSETEKQQMLAFKDAGAAFLALVDEIGGTATDERKASRELAHATTKIEEAVMWAVKHVTA